MSVVSKNKVIVQGDIDTASPTLRITNLENNEYKITYYETVSGTSGSLTVPSQATINADEFGLSGNSILSKIDGFGKPTYQSPSTSGGVAVTANLNPITGAWVTSGAYTDASVALIYSIRIKAVYMSNLTYNNIIGDIQVNTPTLQQVVATGNTSTNSIILTGSAGVTSNFFTKVGGLVSQFLKADGSVDSTSYQPSLGFTPENLANKGVANGYASLDASGLVPPNQIPAYTATAGGDLSGNYPNPAVLNSAVLAKLLTGLNITGSSIVNTDTLLQAFGKIQNQLNGVLGGAIYHGTYNATTNIPTLVDGTGTQGWYYVVATAGLHNFGSGNIDLQVGDWVIYNGTIWQKVDNTDAVSSVNGFIGAVNLTSANITEVTNLYFTAARTLATALTGYVSGAGTVSATDSILQAIQKLNGNIVALTTASVPDSTNRRYITDANLVVVNNTSGVNTGDNAVNSNYVNDYRLANFIAGTNYLAPNGSAAALTLFPTLNQNTTGSAGTLATARVISATGEATFATTAFDGSAPVSGVITLTNLAVISKILTGYVSASGTVLSTDNILQAIQKLNGNISGLTTGVSSVFGRTGVIVSATGDYNTSQIPENTNLYFTNARALLAAPAETLSTIATINHSATVKTTLVDADEITGQDSASSFALIRTTWLNVKVFLKTYFDTIYTTTSAVASQITSALSLFKTANFLDATSSIQTQLNGKQAVLFENNPAILLQRFRAKPNSTTRKIAWVGDSTTDQLFSASVGGYPVLIRAPYNTTDSYAYNNLGFLNGPMYNVQSFNAGSNGNTCLNFINNAVTGKNVSDVATFNPDLIVFCYGINDVRLGLCDYATLTSRITSAVNQLQIACPNCDIILRMPNSLIYDSANTNTYIDAPISQVKVQGYSDILRNAYRDLTGVFKNVYVLDVQKGTGSIFNETVNTLANKGFYHSDALHPNGEGYAAIIREVAILLGKYNDVRFAMQSVKKLPFLLEKSPYKIKQSYTVSTTAPYLYNPRICEDPKYFNLILDGIFQGGAAGSYMDVATNTEIAANLYCGAVTSLDVIVQYNIEQITSGSQSENIEQGVASFQFVGGSRGDSGANIRCLSMPAGYPKTQNAGLPLRLYRQRPIAQKNDYDPNFTAVLVQADFTATNLNYVVQRFGVVAILSSISVTAPTTGGTIDIKKNGVIFATLTIASASTTSVVSGTFVGANTKGTYFDEGDIISAVINAGFVGGSYIKIELSNH